MSSPRERRQADLFYADLFGLSRPSAARRRSPASGPRFSEQAPSTWTDYRNGRVVFYDRNTLRFVEGWTRHTSSDQVFLIDRPVFDPIRADGRRRARELDDYLRASIPGRGKPEFPLYMIHPTYHTAPLNPRSTDWDDLMIEELIDKARPLFIEPLAAQERMIDRLFGLAKQDALNAARAGARGVSAREFVAFFLLDSVTARLTMLQATNVTMQGNHARIALDTRRGSSTTFKVVPGNPHGPIVIGDVHTHVLVDPLIDLSSTRTGMSSGPTRTVHSGVSPIDVESARNDQIVVYAVDSKRLHRVSPNGTITDGIERPHNLLREALRIFGGEPA